MADSVKGRNRAARGLLQQYYGIDSNQRINRLSELDNPEFNSEEYIKQTCSELGSTF
jgi:hypothetical protein